MPSGAQSAGYRGRFAPTPSGPLHFGSLVAALASFLDARAAGGEWLLRMEDLDRVREVPGAAQDILRVLDAFGFEWDGPVLYQSTRVDAYAEAAERLRAAGLVFACSCSRRDIAAVAKLGPEGPIYPGTCRKGPSSGRAQRSLRFRAADETILAQDRIQGQLHQNVAREIGDFVLRRADGLYAYQLAAVVDDDYQGVSQVVRGADLLLSTPRQISLLQALAYPVPAYAHLPLAVDDSGRKLSKSHAAAPVGPANACAALLQAWRFLGQDPFDDAPANLQEFWNQALSAWDTRRVPRCRYKRLQGLALAD